MEKACMPTVWRRLNICCPAAMLEAAADLTAGITGEAVELREAADNGPGRILACLPVSGAETVRERLRRELAELAAIFSLPAPTIDEEELPLENWAENWKHHFQVEELAPGLWIKPSWAEPPPGDGLVIELDPGRAFGTGQHASTRLALGLLLRACRERLPATALDLGTGTGILAMALALSGVPRVLALDNDPEAVTVADDNVAANRLRHIVQVAGTPLEQVAGPFDCICANIVHDVLIELAPCLASLLAPGGALILAGILGGAQEDNIVQCHAALGLHEGMRLHQGEWVGILLRKTPT